MQISLNEHLESYVKSKIESGDYNNSTDVVQEALLLLQEQDEKKQILKNEIQKGVDSIEAGRYTTKTPRQIFHEVLAKRKGIENNS